MDPITLYRLGQIRQQEFLAECLRDQDGRDFGAKRGVAALWQRLRERISTTLTAEPQKNTARRPHLSATP